MNGDIPNSAQSGLTKSRTRNNMVPKISVEDTSKLYQPAYTSNILTPPSIGKTTTVSSSFNVAPVTAFNTSRVPTLPDATQVLTPTDTDIDIQGLLSGSTNDR